MTLTNRLTLFYLVTLAVVLVAFAGSAYGLMRTVLLRQLTQRATSTLDTLVATAEIEPAGFDWEPQSRKLHLGSDSKDATWAVFDGAGRQIDGTKNANHELTQYAVPESDMEQSRFDVTWAGQPRWVIRRTIHHPQAEALDGNAQPPNPLHRTLVFVTACP